MATQARAHETRAAIITAASSLFRLRGYGGTSQDDVAESAGVTKGALYFHFTSKEHIAYAVIDAQHDAAMELVDGIAIEGIKGLAAVLEMTYRFARLLRTDAIVQAGIRLTMESSNLSRPIVEPYRDWMKAAESQLEIAQRAGEVRGSVDVATVAHFIIPAFTGVQLTSEGLAGRTDLYQRIDEMWGLLLPALMVPDRLDEFVQMSTRLRNNIPTRS